MKKARVASFVESGLLAHAAKVFALEYAWVEKPSLA